MKINIESLNRKAFKIALTECIERDTVTKNMFKSQIADGDTYGDPEGFDETYQKYIRMEEYFMELIKKVRRNNFIDIIDEEMEFIAHLIADQIHISNERIKDWEPTGNLYSFFKNQYLVVNPDGDIKEFDKCADSMIQYDKDLLELCAKLKELINI
jgi:hypothetical protein